MSIEGTVRLTLPCEQRMYRREGVRLVGPSTPEGVGTPFRNGLSGSMQRPLPRVSETGHRSRPPATRTDSSSASRLRKRVGLPSDPTRHRTNERIPNRRADCGRGSGHTPVRAGNMPSRRRRTLTCVSALKRKRPRRLAPCSALSLPVSPLMASRLISKPRSFVIAWRCSADDVADGVFSRRRLGWNRPSPPAWVVWLLPWRHIGHVKLE